jgi:putative endonuclease
MARRSSSRFGRGATRHGGAAGSVGAVKRRRLVFAAAHFLRRLATPPPCRFDVVTIEGDRIEWLRAAFDAS